MVGKKNVGGKIVKLLVLLLFAFVFIVPLWLILTSSFEESMSFTKNGYSLVVRDMSVAAYKRLFGETLFWRSFLNSFWVTAVTVVLSVTINTVTAYVLHEKELPFHGLLNFLFVFTMFFNAGMIPTYLIIKSLNMLDSFVSMILPPALSVYNVLLVRNYLYSLPKAMEEAALVDGANHFQILFTVVVPVSKPIIITTALITLISKWNSWMDVLLYTRSKEELWTVQYYIRTLINAVNSENVSTEGNNLQGEQVLSAAIVVTILPVVLLFPTLQKYFANGITLGSVKG